MIILKVYCSKNTAPSGSQPIVVLQLVSCKPYHRTVVSPGTVTNSSPPTGGGITKVSLTLPCKLLLSLTTVAILTEKAMPRCCFLGTTARESSNLHSKGMQNRTPPPLL